MRWLRVALLLAVCCAAVAAPARRSNSTALADSPAPAPKERPAKARNTRPKEGKAGSAAVEPQGAPEPAPGPQPSPAGWVPSPLAAPSKDGKKGGKVTAKDMEEEEKLHVQAEDWLPSSSMPAARGGHAELPLLPPPPLPPLMLRVPLQAHLPAAGELTHQPLHSARMLCSDGITQAAKGHVSCRGSPIHSVGAHGCRWAAGLRPDWQRDRHARGQRLPRARHHVCHAGGHK